MLSTDLNLGSILDPAGRETNVAVIDGNGCRSYAALDAAANAVATEVARSGLSRGDRVAILGDNNADYLAVLFGAMRAGCTVVPISTRQLPRVVADMIRHAKVKLVFASAALASSVPPSVKSVPLACESLVKGNADAIRPMQPRTDDTAELIFTSGSTGRPRAVALTHRGQIWFLNALLNSTGWIQETALVAAPLYHSNALIRVKCAFACAGTIVLQSRFSPEKYLAAISEHKVTLLTGVPAMYEMLLSQRDLIRSLDLSSVRRIMIGSAAAPEPLVDALQGTFPNARIGIAYGLTEAGGTVCSTLYRPQGRTAPRGSVGVMLPGIEARLEGESASDGVLYLRSPAISPGYDGDPEQNAARFVQGWLRTDDVLRRDEDGFYYFRGRADDMFVVGGENVYPAEVETLIGSHPLVRQAAVVPIPHEIKGAVPLVFVVPYQDGSVSAEEIKDYALRNGPSHLHPRQIVFLDAMPLTGTGKIDYAALRTRAVGVAIPNKT